MTNPSHFMWQEKLQQVLTQRYLHAILVETFDSMAIRDVVKSTIETLKGDCIEPQLPINIKGIQELRRDLNLRSQKERFVLLPSADMMSREVSNTLLKTLEEGLSGVVFILIAKPHAVLSTIRSRCCVIFAQTEIEIEAESEFQHAAELFQKMQKHKDGNFRDVVEVFLQSQEKYITDSLQLHKNKKHVLDIALASLQKTFVSRIEAENIILQWKYA